ncbi:hypothetical protein N7466_003154 [Penicillium verhagenii]|uniref:uncharacterized protein n=1 Tax=Penicillium verhagenii TaxID=1562060 RepID=UPI0025452C1F|nr:uncharacterized protein N7466_003154 [Penicillium verhagenii]KAJ5936704.1 hypothetical protein N7466_003154 [Penicillium verhagenii]
MLLSWTPSSILFWVVSAGCLVLCWLAKSIIYELYFSPLSRFPGPRSWIVSRIPLQLSVLRGYNHLDITALHDRYGPVVRIGPTELAFNTARAFRDIYGDRPGGCFPKDRSHYVPPANGVDNLVCAIDHGVHARQRRLLAHAFSDRALRDQEGLITGYVDTLISKLRDEVGDNINSLVDIKEWMNFTTFDITGDLMFGESFGCLKDSQLHPWIQLIFSSIKAISITGVVQQFSLLKIMLAALIPAEVKRKARAHFDLSAMKVDRRLDASTSRPDFMSAILQNGLSEDKGQYKDGEKIMSRAEIHANAFIHATTHRRDSIRLRQRHRHHLPYRRRLTYLGAVIEESLRMYPPFVTSLSRIVPAGGSTVDSQYIPEGTTVACHHYASYHSASNFTFPHDFLPERWLDETGRFAEDKKDVLQPFSLGPRNCLGKK